MILRPDTCDCIIHIDTQYSLLYFEIMCDIHFRLSVDTNEPVFENIISETTRKNTAVYKLIESAPDFMVDVIPIPNTKQTFKRLKHGIEIDFTYIVNEQDQKTRLLELQPTGISELTIDEKSKIQTAINDTTITLKDPVLNKEDSTQVIK